MSGFRGKRRSVAAARWDDTRQDRTSNPWCLVVVLDRRLEGQDSAGSKRLLLLEQAAPELCRQGEVHGGDGSTKGAAGASPSTPQLYLPSPVEKQRLIFSDPTV